MATLVIGASGLVGYEFYRQNRGKKDWFFTYRSKKVDGFFQLDATDAQAVEALFSSIKPDVVILPAAFANVNVCETERQRAYDNNVGVLRNVLAAMKGRGVLVFFSTDYLFDGKRGPYDEDAKPNPLNYYGKLKLQCEEEIKKSGIEYLIIRTTGVFGWELQRKNFFYRVMDTLSAGKTLEVPSDQFDNVTYVKDLVSATTQLLEMGKRGVWNVAGPEIFSKEQVARIYASFLGLDSRLIVGKPTSQLPPSAPRPLKSGFRIDKLRKAGISMRGVKEALEDMKKRKEEDDKYDSG
ncbi:MAG: NAD(P)-dependent oxidoreductase [Candidatus Micrarchaeota archaeon]|nr:NAD(P)-dependent oxidoreductase [Candidatus Micrarchaeota archaeon]